jgi:hypothetical protein
MNKFATEHQEAAPAGMVRLRLGDVCELRRMRHICGMVNRSRALMYPMAKDSHEVKPRFEDETFTVSAYAGPKGITPVVEKEFVLERLGVDGWENFRDSKKRKATDMRLELGDVIGWNEETTSEDGSAMRRCTVVAVDAKKARIAWNTVTGGGTDTTGKVTPQSVVLGSVVIARDINEYYLVHRSRLTEHERAAELKNFLAASGEAASELTKEIGAEETVGATDMSKKAKTTKNKASGGGLAADALKSKGTKKTSSRAEWLGHPVTSVLRALGKAGVSVAHARAIVKKAGVAAADATVSIQVSAAKYKPSDKNFRGEPADLTAEQFKTLIASAPEPVKETKETK